MFERSQKIIDDIQDEITILLAALNNRTTWTQRCKDELENLKKALLKKKYKSFLGHPSRYHLSAIGESCLYDVSVFKWFETDGLISQRRDWLIGFKV